MTRTGSLLCWLALETARNFHHTWSLNAKHYQRIWCFLTLVVRCQEKGWMNEDLVKDWLNTVWSKVSVLSHRKSMLVWDSFRAHLSNPVRRTLQSLNTECAVIPGGMTGILQPLDVSINKPFKDHLRNKWQQWMMSGEPP